MRIIALLLLLAGIALLGNSLLGWGVGALPVVGLAALVLGAIGLVLTRKRQTTVWLAAR